MIDSVFLSLFTLDLIRILCHNNIIERVDIMAFDINKKVIPIGISDFKSFYEKDYYYVDKTLMIKDILDKKPHVGLFTRPRRFGKTLNQSMIKYFFEKTEEDNSYLFKDLKIWQAGERYTSEQGKYPVINLTFKGARMNTWDETYIDLINSISDEYRRHEYLRDVIKNSKEKKVFDDIRNRQADFSDYVLSIKNLCMYLEKYHGQKPIILIDEYDVPIQNSYIIGFYDEAINFLRALLQAALKDNNYLEFAIITGCLRVSKESIFTGLNNLDIISILDKQYSEHFGFTQEEVDGILRYYDLENKREEIKRWYDGYKFAESDIYNPWSVLKCAKDMTLGSSFPQAYWVNTSGNDIVKKLILNASETAKNEIEVLINGGTIEKTLNANVTYNELDDREENIWSMLFFTGYLTYTKERRKGRSSSYELRIPNEELLYVYETIIMSWFQEKVKERDFSTLYSALIDADEETLSDEISEFLMRNISFYDAGESFYHGLLTGILSRVEDYCLHSNLESGLGRSDIMIVPYNFKKPAIILELKVAKDIDELEAKCDEALKQIEEKSYDTYLRKNGFRSSLKYGIAFYGKRCLVKVKNII